MLRALHRRWWQLWPQLCCAGSTHEQPGQGTGLLLCEGAEPGLGNPGSPGSYLSHTDEFCG